MQHFLNTVSISGNKKIGPIPASWSTLSTCPPSCPLLTPPPGKKSPPCYYWAGFFTKRHAKHLEDAGEHIGITPEQFIGWILMLPLRATWRDRVGGDQIPSRADPETIDEKQFRKVIKANKRRKALALAYTHYDLLKNSLNRALALEGYKYGYVLNASTNSMREAITLKKAHPELSVVTLAAHHDYATKDQTIEGVRFTLCPNVWDPRITCKRCLICTKPHRKTVVVFPGHGPGKLSINIIATDKAA